MVDQVSQTVREHWIGVAFAEAASTPSLAGLPLRLGPLIVSHPLASLHKSLLYASSIIAEIKTSAAAWKTSMDGIQMSSNAFVTYCCQRTHLMIG